MVRVKICGITNIEDALLAVRYGADAIGFVFAESPRRITPQAAASITKQLPPFVSKVGVFVDELRSIVHDICEMCGLDTVQLHGEESPEYAGSLKPAVIKSIRIKDDASLKAMQSYHASAYLLDTYDDALRGGTGRTFDWSLAKKAKKHGLVILSGGLTPENVREAVEAVKPYAVDVSSGIEEKPGKKDEKKLKEFIKQAKCVGKDE
jgi:phosphoribosylanthranilate isomerase